MTARSANSVAADKGAAEVRAVMRAVSAPPPILEREREASLSQRQLELLDSLGHIFASGFIDLTMADLAQQLNCSLRTLYLLADSRNRLVAIVIDRTLRAHGRSAHEAVDRQTTALGALQAYLHGANNAVARVNEAFAADMASIAEGVALNDAHSNYLIDVTRALLDLAIERDEMAYADTAALARMLGGLGRDFARPEVLPTLDNTPADSANAVVDLVVAALRGTK